MSDHTSAEIFCDLFVMFAQEVTDQDIRHARQVWRMAWQRDFMFEQMECDAELVKLGLARPGEDDGYPIHEYKDKEGNWP